MNNNNEKIIGFLKKLNKLCQKENIFIESDDIFFMVPVWARWEKGEQKMVTDDSPCLNDTCRIGIRMVEIDGKPRDLKTKVVLETTFVNMRKGKVVEFSE